MAIVPVLRGWIFRGNLCFMAFIARTKTSFRIHLICVLVAFVVLIPAFGDTIDVSSQYLVPFQRGDTLDIDFGIWNYSSQTLAQGFSPYPIGLYLSLLGLVPTGPVANFSISASLESNDGQVVVPFGVVPLSLATFSAFGGSEPAGLFFAPVSFTNDISQRLFAPSSFTPGNNSAARIVATNLGDGFTIGIDGIFANQFPIGGCCSVEAVGIHGSAPFSTGGNTGHVLLITPPEPLPEPATWVLLLAGSWFICLLKCVRRHPLMHTPKRTSPQ